MASTNKTANLNLNQWSLSDKPEMADFNADNTKVDTAVSAHLAESAGRHITESGSNTNGEYIKFDDGTMICYGHRPMEGQTTSTGGTRSILFPASFTSLSSLKAIMGSATTSSVAYTSDWRIVSVFKHTDLSAFNVMFNKASTTIPTHLGVYWTAIGRWKA